MTHLTAQALGTAAAAAALATPAGGRFRRVARLSLATDGVATGLRIAGPVPLRVVFSPWEADALGAGAIERATLAAEPHGLTLHLPAARAVGRVQLASAIGHDKVAAYRFDGKAASSDPVAAEEQGSGGARLDVTDRQLILRRLHDGTPLPLAAADIRSVFLTYRPLAPRIGIALPADHAPPDFAAAATAVAAPGGAVALSVDLAAALAARIARLPSPLPNPLAVDLVLEADEPCLAAVAELGLSYSLVASAFPPGAPKQKLSFGGGPATARSVVLAVPPTATIVSLPVTLDGLPNAASGAGGAIALGSTGPAPDPAALGLAFTGEETALASIRVDAAAIVTGACAELAAPEEAEVVASLWDASEPAPRQLSESRAVAVPARPGAVAFAFAKPVVLPAGRATLAFRATRGRAVLALGAGTGDTATLRTAEGTSTPPAAAGLAPRVLLVRAEVAAGSSHASPLAVSVAGHPIETSPAPSGRGAVAELAPLLNAMPRPRPPALSLIVTSSLKAVVTIDAPAIVYDPG